MMPKVYWSKSKPIKNQSISIVWKCNSSPWAYSLFIILQNLPALVLKIMSETFAPISDRYSPELRQLIMNMLNLDPSKRPQLNEIMANPVCIKPLLNLFADIGNVKMCR